MANNPHDPAALLAELLALDIDNLDVAGVRSALGRNRLVESAVSSLDAALRARARALTPPPARSPTGQIGDQSTALQVDPSRMSLLKRGHCLDSSSESFLGITTQQHPRPTRFLDEFDKSIMHGRSDLSPVT